MSSYVVRPEDNGTFTLVLTFDGGRVREVPGYIYQATARLDGYRACNPPRELSGYGTGSDHRRGWRR